jgi:hypothetical protein
MPVDYRLHLLSGESHLFGGWRLCRLSANLGWILGGRTMQHVSDVWFPFRFFFFGNEIQ